VHHRHVERAATPPSSTWSTNQTETHTCLPNFLISAERTVVAAHYAEFGTTSRSPISKNGLANAQQCQYRRSSGWDVVWL
jgi:hypothetical protein